MNTLILAGKVKENSGVKYTKNGKKMLTIFIEDDEENVFSVLFFENACESASIINAESYVCIKCTVKSKKIEKEGKGAFYSLWISGGKIDVIGGQGNNSSVSDEDCNDIPF